MLNKKKLPPSESFGISLDHQRLVTLLNSMSDGVIAIGSDYKTVMNNGAILDILNLNSVMEKNIDDIFKLTTKEGTRVGLKSVIESNPHGFTSRDYKLKFSDESTINIYLSFSPVMDTYGKNENRGYVIIVRDITREKLVEVERDEFVSVAGHELRTPVTIAEGSLSNAEFMAKQSNLSEPILQSIQAAHKQVVFLSEMINDLAMLSRADRGKNALNIENFDVVLMAKELVANYQPQALTKNLELSLQTDTKSLMISSSSLYIHEIMQNLITNSLKYTQKGNITLNIASLDDGTQLKVVDTGIGISQAEQKKLFSKFFRSEDSRVKKVHGTGLGLYVCIKLAKLIGAQLSVSSVLNEGSTVSLVIPNLKLPKTS